MAKQLPPEDPTHVPDTAFDAPFKEEVFPQEIEEINVRRRQAGLAPVGAQADDLVGVALSGGGIRSASFNLGVLQAFQESGLLRYADYLSTVSGGGYVGSYYSSLVLDGPVAADGTPAPLQPEPSGRQPAAVQQLIDNGAFLNRPGKLINRYLIGLLAFNLAFGSGVVLFCTLIAYLWRWLDTPPFHNRLLWASGGRILDQTRPFLPAAVVLLLWLLAWTWLVICGIASWPGGGRWVRRASKYLLLAAGTFMLVGAAVWLGNPNINRVAPDDLYAPPSVKRALPTSAAAGAPAPPRARQETPFITAHQDVLLPLLLLLVALLLPFLKPWALLESGERPRQSWQGAVFRLASVAALVGLPLAVVFWLARHNLSGVASDPGRPLVSADIQDWEAFWDKRRADRGDHLAARAQQAAAVLGIGSCNGPAWVLAVPGVASPAGTASLGSRLMELLEKYEPDAFTIVNNADRTRQLQRLSFDRIRQTTFEEYQRVNDDMDRVCKALDRVLGKPDLSADLRLRWDDLSDSAAQLAARQGDRHASGERSNEEEAQVFLALARKRTSDLDARDQPSTLAEAEKARLELKEPELRALHHLLLRAYYPGLVQPVSRILRPVMVEQDQHYRLWIMALALAVFAVAATLLNMNETSPHWYYRTQLAKAYVVGAGEGGRELLLRDLDTTARGAPYHLLSGTINFLGHHPARIHTSESFLFSRRFCGSPSPLIGYEATSTYLEGSLDLAGAMAISGAAVSPLRIRNPLVALLMTLLNLRLGQWLPAPRSRARGERPARRFVDFLRRRPSLLGLMVDRLHPLEQRRYYFISDGGHSENLGIEPLLLRGCALIVASDAGQDPAHHFDDLAKLYRLARLQGIRLYQLQEGEMWLELGDLELKAGLCRASYIVARVKYPDRKESGLLVYIKPSFTGSEEIDLKHYRQVRPEFPHDPTIHQVYDADHVESYRQLGYSIATQVCVKLASRKWNTPRIDVKQVLASLHVPAPAAVPGSPDGHVPLAPSGDTIADVHPAAESIGVKSR